MQNQTGCLLDAAEAAELRNASGDSTGFFDLLAQEIDWDVDDQFIDELQVAQTSRMTVMETKCGILQLFFKLVLRNRVDAATLSPHPRIKSLDGLSSAYRQGVPTPQKAAAEKEQRAQPWRKVAYQVTVSSTACQHLLPRDAFSPALQVTLHGWRGSEGPFPLSEDNCLSRDLLPFGPNGSMDMFQVRACIPRVRARARVQHPSHATVHREVIVTRCLVGRTSAILFPGMAGSLGSSELGGPRGKETNTSSRSSADLGIGRGLCVWSG